MIEFWGVSFLNKIKSVKNFKGKTNFGKFVCILQIKNNICKMQTNMQYALNPTWYGSRVLQSKDE